MQRIAIAILVVLGIAAASCNKKKDGEAGGGSAAAGSATAGGSAASAAAGGSAASGAPAGSGSAATGDSIPECDAFIAAVDKLGSCESLKSKADAIHQTANL